MQTPKRILITGATSGIGREIAIRLLSGGADVALCGRSADKLRALEATTKAARGKTLARAFDISDEAQIIQFIEDSIAAIGDIDVLINCAGINSERARVESISTIELEKMVQVNLIAPVIFTREIYRRMIDRREGTILNILSTVCSFPNEGIASYTASKAGLDAFTKVLRKEARDHNIKVCSVYPGGVDTPFRREARPQYLPAGAVADAVCALLALNEQSCMDEIVIRPMVEKNF